MVLPKFQRNRLKDLIHFTGFILVVLLCFVCCLAWLLPSSSVQHLGAGAGPILSSTTKTRTSSSESALLLVDSTLPHKKKKKKKNPLIIGITPPLLRGRFSIPGKNRIAIILPFVGEKRESIPSYLNTFCVGAAGAADVVDFLLIHNGILDNNNDNDGDESDVEDTSGTSSNGFDCPANVKFLSLGSTEVFAEHLLRVVDHKKDDELALSRRRLVTVVSKHIDTCPYCLVEFKAALGYIFKDYLVGYSHWGYADLDMLFGDLGRWITPDELHDFDIVTYGFGDSTRLYLRGQFTFHKNSDKINQIWRSCKYLSDLDSRLVSVIHGDEKYRFESAEGCYSLAVLQQKDIRVKYAVKAWTDIHEEDTAYTNGIYIARNQKKDKVVVYKAESADFGKELINLRPTWFEMDTVYKERKQVLQELVGEMQEIDLPNDPDAKCMYWVQKKYQSNLCLSESVVTSETIFWINGKLFKQSHKNTPLETRVLTAPFFHFQEWKRYFRPSQLTALHHSSPVSLFVLVKEGVIPLPLANERSSYSRVIPSPLQIPTTRWKPATSEFRTLLPSRSYCLISGPRKFPPQPPAPACYQQVSWRDEKKVEILSGAPGWTNARMDLDVTLVLTLQLTELQSGNPQSLSGFLDIIVENLTRWQGQPCVVIIHVAGATEEAMVLLRQRLGPDSNLPVGVENCLIATVSDEEDNTVSRKALQNMAIDAVPTRWYISGIELERGLVLSADTMYFAHRALLTHDSNSWDVFVIPQFAVNEEDGGLDVSLSDLESDAFEVRAPSDTEKACGGDVVVHLEKSEALWWEKVETMLDSDKPEAIITAERIEDVEISLLEYLTYEHHLDMFALDESPILLMDNVGPNPGMRTDEVVREVEELGGRRCYNGLKLAQLATFGYRFNVLGGAFAVSTETTRKASMAGVDESQPGSSRCDGCFMFGDEHEDILEDIIGDEIRRPGKMAVLWKELFDSEQKGKAI